MPITQCPITQCPHSVIPRGVTRPARFPQVPADPSRQGWWVSCENSMCFGCKQPWVRHHFCKEVTSTLTSPSHLEVTSNHMESALHMVDV